MTLRNLVLECQFYKLLGDGSRVQESALCVLPVGFYGRMVRVVRLSVKMLCHLAAKFILE